MSAPTIDLSGLYVLISTAVNGLIQVGTAIVNSVVSAFTSQPVLTLIGMAISLAVISYAVQRATGWDLVGFLRSMFGRLGEWVSGFVSL